MEFEIHQDMAGVPYRSQYYGYWEISDHAAMMLQQVCENLQLSLHLERQSVKPREVLATEDYQTTDDGIAIIPIHGVMMKHESSVTESVSTAVARRQVRRAVNDAGVEAIMLHIDSPGGTVAGSGDLADEVYNAAQQKRTIAFIEDLAASAAYKIASQANEIIANRGEAVVGSLGTFAVVHDVSKAAEQEGIKVHVIRAGEFKGAFTPGTEVTDEQLEELQREINSMQAAFRQMVERGRGSRISDTESLFDGRVHSANDAMSLGLVDAVGSFDATMARLVKTASRPNRRNAMADTNDRPEPQAATVEQIEKTCPGADSKFILEMVKGQATVNDAQEHWMLRLSEQLEESTQRIAELVTELEELKKPKPATGVEALGTTGLDTLEDAEEEFHKLVMEASKRMPRARAISYVSRKHPDVYAKFRAAGAV